MLQGFIVYINLLTNTILSSKTTCMFKRGCSFLTSVSVITH